MAHIVRIAADTQLTLKLPIRILGGRLVHTGATTGAIYDEADNSATAAAKRIALATTTTKLSDDAKIPPQGVIFPSGCFIDWTAGEIFLTLP